MLSPYDLDPFQEGLKFTTGNGSRYYAYFSDLSDTFESSVVEFSFEQIGLPAQGVRKIYDPRISHTICKILDDFLATHTSTIVAYSALHDAKAARTTRMKIFNKWFLDLQAHLTCSNLISDKVIFKTKSNEHTVCVLYHQVFKEEADLILSDKFPGIIMQVLEQKE